jgi:hypothetical protein
MPIPAPKLLAEFAEDRPQWRLWMAKLDCWEAFRDLHFYAHDLRFLVTPNWRDKESPHDWIGEVIDCSDGNARHAAYRGSADEVLEEMRQAERALDLVQNLRTEHGSRSQVLTQLESLRPNQLAVVRKALGVRVGAALLTRARIADMVCCCTHATKAGL